MSSLCQANYSTIVSTPKNTACLISELNIQNAAKEANMSVDNYVKHLEKECNCELMQKQTLAVNRSPALFYNLKKN